MRVGGRELSDGRISATERYLRCEQFLAAGRIHDYVIALSELRLMTFNSNEVENSKGLELSTTQRINVMLTLLSDNPLAAVNLSNRDPRRLSKIDIRKSFHALATKIHPDKQKTAHPDDVHQLFVITSEAFGKLIDGGWNISYCSDENQIFAAITLSPIE